ncbi:MULTISPECIES: DUF1802 family protein [Sphaerospermopsis]|uniref:DUF1802 domain-containing protein n=1 Tax=Sphaerospermopsis reniformis TaxID=531300 RepID=A0A480A651_9CYAN|nr:MULTISPECIES: DUF1802 family protein [Sphaerospermopsis]MBD2146612.1 DUF1802 family protein [Sphaerospermopsis sp. FACHB-1194]GCL38808.1 hypothetical protein SR1949_39270 [Sphaerospermopsis reniformis]
MNKSISIYNALCLPAPDVEALIQGQIITALPQKLLNLGQIFALYPVDISTIGIDKYYSSSFLATTQSVNNQVNYEEVTIKSWARCEFLEIPDKSKQLDILSQLTIWKPERFEKILQNRPHFFLAYLRVYHLDKPYEIPAIPNIQEKLGKFAPLPNNISVSEAKPVLSDHVFNQRKQQLENRQPPLHPELEELQILLLAIANNNLVAQQLEQEIRVFLGWSSKQTTNTLKSDLAWIKTIATLGDRSIEFEEKKTNYQAGTDFENISRKSLEFLGFKVEESCKGGAGGLDLYCSQPYPLVCECKAGRSIPDRAVEELDRIGKRHLQENYLQALRLIIGPGEPTKQLKESLIKSAKLSKTSVIKAMTLQKLVELKAKYPGAIDLMELKKYLEPGQIDDKINEYIEKVEQEIKLRSHIIQLVKNYLQNAGIESTGVDTLHGAYFGSHPPQPLKPEEMHEILIELSSPLTGYLGREKGNDWKNDKFYYLRDLAI